MINKVYVKFKNFIKENYKQLIFLLLFYIIMTFPLPYYICVSGGTIDVNDRVEIEDSSKSEGSFNLSYVTEIRATVPTFLLSYVIPSWEVIDISDYRTNNKESIEEIEARDKLYLEEGNLNALRVAYKKANKEITIKNNKYYIVYIDSKVSSDIEVGDMLVKADNMYINSIGDYKALVQSKNYGDVVSLELLRDNKKVKTDIKVQKIDGQKLTGISIVNIADYEVNPNIQFKFDKNESGSSGGLMLTLSIYDKLVNEDITKGLKIVGTGTIDADGNVGEIGGVKYKLMGAVRAKADIFLAPKGDNYNDCVKLKKEKNYDIKILEVSTFEDALNQLKKN